MKNEPPGPFQLADLRERAEAELKLAAEKRGHDPINFSPWSAHLIHELQTHQIELESQNETLRQTHLELVESQERFSNLYDFAPVGYLTLDEEAKIAEANLTVADLLRVDRGKLIGDWLRRYVAPEDQDDFYLHFHKQGGDSTGGRMTVDLRLKQADGSHFPARLIIATVQHEGRARRLVAIVDCTPPQQNANEAPNHYAGNSSPPDEVLDTLEAMNAAVNRLLRDELADEHSTNTAEFQKLSESIAQIKVSIKELVAAKTKVPPENLL